MFDQINNMFQFSKNALNILAYRQKIISANIANADTPHYQALNVDFKNKFNQMVNQNKHRLHLLNTSNKHLHSLITDTQLNKDTENQTVFIDEYSNNNVDINQERINFIDNSLKYQAQMAFLNNEIKNIMTVIQG